MNPSNCCDYQLRLSELLARKAPDPEQLLLISYSSIFSWSGEFPTGLHGVEIFNPKALASSAWEKSKLNVLWSLLVLPANPKYSFLRLYQHPIDALAWWDQKLMTQFLVGFAGAEASARALPLPNWLLQFPSYQRSFEIFSNHVLSKGELTGNYRKDRQRIFHGLQAGEFFMSLDLLGDPTGFYCLLENQGQRELPGHQLLYQKNQKIFCELPEEPKFFYEQVVLKDGERVFTTNSQTFQYQIKGPGAYRIVVRVIPTLPFPDGKKWMSWIVTNPWALRN